MNKKRRILSLLLAALMVTGLCGCGSTSSACPDATVLDGLAIRGNDCQNDQDSVRKKVSEWVTGLGY